jgi:hypothetical protein
MKQLPIQLPDSIYKGLICKVHVSLDGKKSCKELKVCSIKARSITFIEVDKANRQNIFRKVDRKDIVGFSPTAICEITIRDGILPVRWESAWDSIGQPTTPFPHKPGYGKITFSKHSQGWAPKLPSTTNSAAGFPMV